MAAVDATYGPAQVQVVEDDPIVGGDLVATLRQLGYDAPPPLRDVASALIAIERRQPDVAILDIKLSGDGDGIDLAHLLRGRADGLAIIFLTGSSDHETIDRAVRVRPSSYLIKPYSRDAVYAAVETALQGRSRAPAAPPVAAHGSRLKRVLALIEDNLGRNVTLDEMAQEAGLSRDHFGRSFRQSLGLAPHTYLVQRRMTVARRLLETTDQPIVTVAMEVGYDSQAYFTTVFRRECGSTPAAYRRQHRGGGSGGG